MPPERPLQVDRPLEHDARRAHGDRQLVDPADRDARHLPRHPDRPAGPRQHELPALDDPEHLPPVASLFAAFLGYNPMEHLLGPHVLATLPHAQAAALTGRAFFPSLMSGPFAQALNDAFTFALVACLIAAGASLLRGGRYHHEDHAAVGGEAVEPIPSGIAPALQRAS